MSATFFVAVILCPLVIQLALAADPTIGPMAVYSLRKETAYSTARSCAAGCLAYNGVWHCGVNAGYNDLGTNLQCGCSPKNACYCSKGLASSATAYISSCVSAACNKVENWSDEVTSMLGLYDSYCSTANVAVVSSSKVVAATTTDNANAAATTPTDAIGGPDGVSSTRVQIPSSTSGPTSPTSADGNKGLSQSDIVALAASLGVGIPSLLIAGATLWVALRKRRQTRAQAEADRPSPPLMAGSLTAYR